MIIKPALRADARRAASEKMREAGRWWNAFDRAYHEACFWLVRSVARKHRIRLELARPGGARQSVLRRLNELVCEAHDMRLASENNIATCAEAARSAEMMARIYWEEFDEQPPGNEVTFLPHPTRWDNG